MDVPKLPTLREAMRVWARIGLLSFGGPAGQIAMLHREIVEQRRWLGERRFLHALSFCTLLPGPEAQQLATYLGWMMHGPAGAVAAGTLFVLPGAAVLLVLSLLFATLGQIPAVAGLFFGLKCAVIALVVQAVQRLAGRALTTRPALALAVLAFAALNLFALPFPGVVLVAAAVGVLRPCWFRAAPHGNGPDGPPGLIDAVLLADPGRVARQARAARRSGLLALVLWLAPVAALRATHAGVFADIAVFFSKISVVTLGGAYAVLAYVAQDAVHAYHWLSPSEMLAGLGLAETTPGPLILVLQFVGFMAGYRAPGPLSGVTGGMAASALALWVMFMPCFAFVLLGAPLMELLAENRRLAGALAAVTATVAGVICNLAVWLGLHVLFGATVVARLGAAAVELPVAGSLHVTALAVAVLAGFMLWHWRQSAPRTLAAGALSGIVLRFIVPQ